MAVSQASCMQQTPITEGTQAVRNNLFWNRFECSILVGWDFFFLFGLKSFAGTCTRKGHIHMQVGGSVYYLECWVVFCSHKEAETRAEARMVATRQRGHMSGLEIAECPSSFSEFHFFSKTPIWLSFKLHSSAEIPALHFFRHDDWCQTQSICRIEKHLLVFPRPSCKKGFIYLRNSVWHLCTLMKQKENYKQTTKHLSPEKHLTRYVSR